MDAQDKLELTIASRIMAVLVGKSVAEDSPYNDNLRLFDDPRDLAIIALDCAKAVVVEWHERTS